MIPQNVSLIFWCLFAFVAAGFEHGIANMTVFTISLLGNHPEGVSISGMIYNLAWVSIGNIIGGAGFIGIAYFLTSNPIIKGSTAPIIENEDTEQAGNINPQQPL